MPSLIPTNSSSGFPMLRFVTGDAEEFADRMAGLAPGVKCQPIGADAMTTEICGAALPGLGMFRSTLTNFRVYSSVRSFYGVTIPLAGVSRFFVDGVDEEIDRSRMHVQRPDRLFNAQMGEASFSSLQLCFERDFLNSLAGDLSGQGDEEFVPAAVLDLKNPAAQSFARQATFIWSEIMRGGAITESPLIAQETSSLLGSLLVNATGKVGSEAEVAGRECVPSAVRRAEDYLMSRLSIPVSIAEVARVAGVSARSLSRGFRRSFGTTVKGFLKERRLEEANRRLLEADPGQASVTQVALDLGFDQLGRFAGDYKKVFGELPSETLAR
ncbi:AraC family transcriptional regulator [Haloferula sp.]|uniref:AraC family transcriptional regulator n=1 Tax=Haloferula sp. TaxID=2497595 RepID=UPI00329E59D0